MAKEKDNKLSNYLPLNRKIFEHPFWNEDRPYSKFEAWLYLIKAARFEDGEATALMGGKLIKWNWSEHPISLRYLGDEWKWSKNKVDDFLKLLINEGMITKRTQEGTAQTIIKLCNYASYNVKGEFKGQQKGQTRDTEGTGEGQARDESNNTNNLKKEEEGAPAKTPEHTPEEKEMFKSFTAWVSKNAPKLEKMKQPFTLKQYLQIRKKVPKEKVSKLLLKMQNWKPLLQKNESAYLTLLNWYEIDIARGANAPEFDPSTMVEKQKNEYERVLEKNRAALQND